MATYKFCQPPEAESSRPERLSILSSSAGGRAEGTYHLSVLAGKLPWGVCTEQRTSLESVSPAVDVFVAVKSKAVTISGEIGGVVVEIILDSGVTRKIHEKILK